jgi:serine/threonine protein kinase/tetratricopeptide (TPR) repeat protein
MRTVFQRIGPYEILHEIGRGGMAQVFLANDTRANRCVALRLVPTGNGHETDGTLDAERWGAKLQEQFSQANAHVPRVYEHATDDGYFYIAMEYLEGQNLSEVIAAGPVPPARAIQIAIQLCEFLETAHDFEATIDGRQLRSLLHGDLQPRNIRVLPGDRVKVLDFGIAKALSLSRKVTRNDFGSIAYLSPERLESGDIDARADLWAVGVLLYEMASGVRPFEAPDTRRLEHRIQSGRPATPLDDGCPLGLRAIVAKLLAGDPADRYSTPKAIREDLECAAAGTETQAQRDGWPARAYDEPATKRTRRPDVPHEEATRRTTAAAPEVRTTPQTIESAVRADAMPPPSPKKPKKRFWPRLLRVALVVIAFLIVRNEFRVARAAQRLAAVAQTQELDKNLETWREYNDLKARSFRSLSPLERALTRQTMVLADRVFGNYRMPQPTVREAQWRTTREAIAEALTASPGDTRLKAALRYSDGHLHRINGEARKVKKLTTEAKQEFTEAVAAFREAAELRPDWPDPFLGLMRTFIYGLEDVDRGADALQQAQRLGYPQSDRETVQLADGYRARAETFGRTARTLAGMPQEQEYLTRAAEGYRQALELYSKAIGFGDAPRNMRATQRRLTQIEERLKLLSPPATPE